MRTYFTVTLAYGRGLRSTATNGSYHEADACELAADMAQRHGFTIDPELAAHLAAPWGDDWPAYRSVTERASILGGSPGLYEVSISRVRSN